LRAGQPLSFASLIWDSVTVGSYSMRFMIFLGATWRLKFPIFLRNCWSVWDKAWIFTYFIAWLRCIYNVFCNLVTFRACIKIVSPSGLIDVYEFSRSLSFFSDLSNRYQRAHSNLVDAIIATWTPILLKEKNRGVCRT